MTRLNAVLNACWDSWPSDPAIRASVSRPWRSFSPASIILQRVGDPGVRYLLVP